MSMDFLQLCNRRLSVRKYDPSRPIETEKMNYILEAARLAPSACNKQPWRLILVRSSEKLAALSESYDRDWFKSAPVVVAVVMDHNAAWHRNMYDDKDHTDIDASIITEHICLAAAEQGIGTCWVCNFDPEKATAVLSVEGCEEVAVLIPMGYPADDTVFESANKVRKELSSFVSEI